ncbi:tetraacyldisaccharide 4'-kinase [Mariniblastus sp.]|nr:tetraacyldisaccharide 4'-kinase [Mariniblastus sp.]
MISTAPHWHTDAMFDRNQLLEIVNGNRKGMVAAIIRVGLGCFTPVYRAAIYLRNRKFNIASKQSNDQIIRNAGIPVISVGNLTTGGTGKTPMVIWIAKQLRSNGLRVALVSRGYGSENRDGVDGPNDEALEMEHRLPDVPHLQDPDRYRMTQIARHELDSEIIVLDDAFQHRQLARNLDIVLIDATAPFGFNRLLPRGLLREPLDGLSRADLIVLTRIHLISIPNRNTIVQKIKRYAPNTAIAETQTRASHLLQFDGQTEEISKLEGQPIFFFCGIGNPENFKLSLERLDCKIVGSVSYADHYHYQRSDLEHIGDSAKSNGATLIICTHKDLVKLGTNRLGGIPVYAMVVDVEFVSGEKEVKEHLERLIKPAS